MAIFDRNKFEGSFGMDQMSYEPTMDKTKCPSRISLLPVKMPASLPFYMDEEVDTGGWAVNQDVVILLLRFYNL